MFDPRVKIVVSSCGWTPFHDYYNGKLQGWAQDRYMPRIRDVYRLDPDRRPFDFYELVAALAPGTFYSNSPLGDANFAVAGVKQAVAEAQPVYRLPAPPRPCRSATPMRPRLPRPAAAGSISAHGPHFPAHAAAGGAVDSAPGRTPSKLAPDYSWLRVS